MCVRCTLPGENKDVELLWHLTDITESCVDLKVLPLSNVQWFFVLFEKLNL